jgi:protein O-GlcNAc transferase
LVPFADRAAVYHWLGETFLGAWRVWSNYAFRTGLTLPSFKTVAFIKAWSREDLPEGISNGFVWDDLPGANKWFTEKFL